MLKQLHLYQWFAHSFGMKIAFNCTGHITMGSFMGRGNLWLSKKFLVKKGRIILFFEEQAIILHNQAVTHKKLNLLSK